MRRAVFSRRLCSAPSPRPFSNAGEHKQKGIDMAARILAIVCPRSSDEASTGKGSAGGSHSRLIQSCLDDLLRTGGPKEKGSEPRSSDLAQKQYVNLVPDSKEDPWALFLELQRRGFSPDAGLISSALSSAGVVGDISGGSQLQCLSIKTCLETSSPVGSSLITFYSKCGQLEDAEQVFAEISTRDTVVYTSLITAFAHHGYVDSCVHLFVEMRRSASEPNDFTFASLLSACVRTGCLGTGRRFHCLVTQTGFDSHIHVSNALISMYAKCGGINEATHIFVNMEPRDLVSWNSMVFGYAQYGLANRALSLLVEMREWGILPDSISFLGVLSACRHAGLVQRGHACFSLMLKYGIEPAVDHYACVVDLLARAGLLEEAFGFVRKMPMSPNGVVWGSLLSSCRIYGEAEMGKSAALSRLSLEPRCPATHVHLANLCAAGGCWNDFAKVRKLMKERGLKTNPGSSWIEVGSRIREFKAEARENSIVNEQVILLDILDIHMKSLANMIEMKFDPHLWE